MNKDEILETKFYIEQAMKAAGLDIQDWKDRHIVATQEQIGTMQCHLPTHLRVEEDYDNGEPTGLAIFLEVRTIWAS